MHAAHVAVDGRMRVVVVSLSAHRDARVVPDSPLEVVKPGPQVFRITLQVREVARLLVILPTPARLFA